MYIYIRRSLVGHQAAKKSCIWEPVTSFCSNPSPCMSPVTVLTPSLWITVFSLSYSASVYQYLVLRHLTV